MKKILSFLAFFSFFSVVAQPITVSATQYTVEELVQDVLINTPCAAVSNITHVGGATFGNPASIGYFQNTNPLIDMSEGIILSTGNINSAPGPDTNNQSGGTWNADVQLSNYINNYFNVTDNYHDATVLEFDFVPFTNSISFNFIFASEEYGYYQCTFSDPFAFFLTNTQTNVVENLALVPNTNDPISVLTIKDEQYYQGVGDNCGSTNPEYFGVYNNETATTQQSAAINFKGQTVKMVASSDVTPGVTYHIKLVIQDRGDFRYDSAVFLEAGSFGIGVPDLGTNKLISDQTALCGGETTVLDTGLDENDFDFQWSKNGVAIPGATNSTYEVTSTGVYAVNITTVAGGCVLNPDPITIEFFDEIQLYFDPHDLIQCETAGDFTTFDLSTALEGVVAPNMQTTTTYYNTQEAAYVADTAEEIPFLYNKPNDGTTKTVWVRINLNNSNCFKVKSFDIATQTCSIAPNQLDNIYKCTDEASLLFDFSSYEDLAYFGNTNFNVTFYNSEADAQTGNNPIDENLWNQYPGTDGEKIWVRITSVNNFNYYTITSFYLFLNEVPTGVTTNPLSSCEANGGAAVYDLSVAGNFIAAQGNYAVSFYTTEAAANLGLVADQLPMNYTTPATTIYARVENPNTGCFTVVSQELSVVAAIQTTELAPYVLCDFLNDGREVFNLRSRETEIVGSPIPAGLVFSYHETEEDATLNQNQIVTADAYQNIVLGGQTIYVRVAYENSNCFEVVPMQLVLNPTPDTLDTASISLCDVSNNGAEVYDLTSLAETILNGLNPADYTLTYHTTQGNAEAGTPAISNPSSFSNLTANSVFVRVTDNTSGCYSITRVSLKLSATPVVPTVVDTYELCDTNHDGYATFMLETRISQIIGNQEGLAVSFHLNEVDAESNANALPMVYQNAQINVQTLYVRVTNPSTGCYSITTMDIRVEPNPYLDVPTEPYQICNIAGTGGFGSIDLTEYGDELREGTPFTITYYETQVQAEAALNPIANPQAYSNLEASNPVVWLRVVNPTTGCFSIYSISFELIAPPSMPVSLDELSTCDTLGNIYDGLGTIDLTQQTAAILEVNNGNIDGFVIHYYDNEADAQAGVDWITNPTAFQNTSNPQTIWVSIENEQNPTGCRRVRSFEIRIHKSQKLKNPEPISQCETSLPNQGHELFDLTSRELSILNNIQTFGITFTYYTSADDMENDTNAIANPEQYMSTSANQTIYIKVTNQYGCVSTTTLQIRVVPLPEVEENPAAVEVCETAYGSGQGIFDLTEAAFEISNEVPNLVLTYYNTEQAALNQDANGLIADPTNYTSASGFVYVHVSKANVAANENCPIVVALPIKVNPLPTLGQLTPLYACIENTTGFYEFDLHDKDAQVLAGQNPENFSIKYYTTEQLALDDETPVPYIYTNVVAQQQELFVRIENLETGCFQIGSFLLRVEEEVKAFMPQNTTFCEMDFVNDGTTPADLTVMDQQIMGTQNAGPLAVRYYTADGTAIADPTNHTITEGETIIAEVYVTTQGFLCTARVEVVVHTQDGPEIADIADGIICFNFRDASEIVQSYLMDTGLPASDDYQYEWTRNGAAIGENSPTHEAVLEGTYQVTVTYLPTGCSNSRTIVVQKATAIVMDEVIQSQSFEETTAIQIIAMAEGGVDLEYQLDEGEWQDSNIFEDVTPGEHIVRVRVKGATLECPAEMVIQIMSHPQYFTPNGDGFNDTWNIKALKNQPEARVYIFDRYGKLLKELSPSGPGWDGTINGEPMPSTDYWFKATYIDPKTGLEKEVTGHFSLKR